MTIQKIKSGRVPGLAADDFVGEIGQIFYNEDLGDLRLSDGTTPGGILLGTGGGGGSTLYPATTTRLGGIKVGSGLSITTGGILSVNLPIASLENVGGIKIGTGLIIDNTGVVSIDPSYIPTTSSSIAIKKTGVVLTSHVSSINFTGSGVIASVSGNDVTLQIDGGGGGTGGLYGINLDGGQPDSIYGGVNPIDGGYI